MKKKKNKPCLTDDCINKTTNRRIYCKECFNNLDEFNQEVVEHTTRDYYEEMLKND